MFSASCISDQVLASWPLRYIRRYGRDMKKFSFEGGRRCGELAGIFELETDKGNEIFKYGISFFYSACTTFMELELFVLPTHKLHALSSVRKSVCKFSENLARAESKFELG